MRILFMGTPDFALASLQALVEAGHEVCAVFTQPDKPARRGMKLTKSPVKLYAEEQGLPVFQPARVKGDPELVETVRALAPELGVAVAYGKLLPKEILEAPRHGFINVHGSLLPQYRGAAPIQWTVLNGEKTAGVSTMFLCEEMDAGDVIDSRATPVGEGETYGELYERLKILGAALLLDTVRAIGEGTAARTPHDPALVSFAPPIRHEDRPVDWTQSALPGDEPYPRPGPGPGGHRRIRRRQLQALSGAAHGPPHGAGPRQRRLPGQGGAGAGLRRWGDPAGHGAAGPRRQAHGRRRLSAGTQNIV